MASMNDWCLAIEMGNTRSKAALFDTASLRSGPLPPEPQSPVIAWTMQEPFPWRSLALLLPGGTGVVALGGSRPAALERLAGEWRNLAPSPLRDLPVRPIRSHADIGVPLDVDRPDRVGWDRLLAARAALSAGVSDRTLVVVSAGTATTVDLIAGGVFRGGAILPGVDLGGSALHDHTESLPLVEPGRTPQPDRDIPATGRNTEAAITSGLVWGHAGAIAELVRRQTMTRPGNFEIWLTGGAAPLLSSRLPPPCDHPRHAPHLALAGLALALGSAG
jgi:type III pantothenate kinase